MQKYPWMSVNFFFSYKDNLVILMCFLKVKINEIPYTLVKYFLFLKAS